MHRMVYFFRQRWVISLLGLLVLALIIWFVGPLIAIAGHTLLESEFVRLFVILILVLLWGLNNLRRQHKANQADKQIMEGISESSAEEMDEDPVLSPDHSAEEVSILHDRFEEAMQLLRKTSKRKRGGNLYELPWYIIIGPPGCGKTTALVNSGLDFPLADRFGKGALRGVGGTRNCDWWFTNEAVLLDTAGRYTTQDSHEASDSRAWEGFLSLLKKYRRRQPINGVMVAISLADLMTQNERERQNHVRAIKLRLIELQKHLGIHFPVYVLFTKCDLVAGFNEFYDDLGRAERAQVWGMTFPIYKRNRVLDVDAFYNKEYDLLVQRLNDRLQWRLNQERDIQRRGLIYGFPQQIAALKSTTRQFISEIFRPTRYEQQAFIRGVYFTSGTQEGTPIDRLMGSFARTFGMNRRAVPSGSGYGRSYFITDLLQRVMFNESGLVSTNQRFERQLAWVQGGAYTGAILLTIGGALAWSTSYNANLGYVAGVDKAVEEYKELEDGPPGQKTSFKDILPRLQALKSTMEISRAHKDGIPLHMRFGLYQGRALGDAAEDAYKRELHKVFLPVIGRRIEQQIKNASGDTELQYEALKTYLMLGKQKYRDDKLITLWMDLDWERTFRGQASAQENLLGYLKDLLASSPPELPLDNELIKQTRLGLTQVPLAQLLYARLKREFVERDRSPFILSDILGSGGKQVFTRKSGTGLDKPIPGLYTYRGFYETYQKESAKLVKTIRGESWVLGLEGNDLTKAELKLVDKDLQALYFADYIRHWKGLLYDLRIVNFRDLRHATSVLDILSGTRSPLRAALQAVERNTSLDKVPKGSSGLIQKGVEEVADNNRLARLMKDASDQGAIEKPKLPGGEVAQVFERINTVVRGAETEDGATGAVPLDEIMPLLSDLYGHFSAISGGITGGGALSAAMNSGGGQDLIQSVKVEATRQPEPLRTWLNQLTGTSRAVTMGGARTEINAQWQATVLPVCQKALENRYPLKPTARLEVTLEDFGKFFAPGGVIDGFFEENIKPFVDTTHKEWRWRSQGQATLGISNSVLKQFQYAALIKDTFFQGEGDQPQVLFSLKPVYLDARVTQFRLELYDQKYEYRHGPMRFSKATWPAQQEQGLSRVRVIFEGEGKRSTLSAEGPWAWFRILDRSKLTPLSSDRMVATLTAGGRTARYEIRANSVVNPFRMKELQKFRCVEKLK